MTSSEPNSQSNAYVIYEFERRAYRVDDTPVRIGRDASNEVVLRESSVSRFNTEIRRETDRNVIANTGSVAARVNGVPVAEPLPLNEGDRIEIGSAVLTYTEKRLPIGVSIVEKAKRRATADDVASRRTTIKHPLLKSGEFETPVDSTRRVKILIALAIVVLVVYFLGR